VNVYEPRGEYQFIVEHMEPKGRGDLQLAFEQLKARLQQEGLFDEKHKKALPLLPRSIAVVTSPTGAAVRDILQVIDRRFSNYAITIVPVKVQGEEAPDEIADGVRLACTHAAPDVIILGRGGGSLEDLWAFNTEKVARAVFESPVPVVSAVGHEIDYTITDFAADVRAPTPSAAAEMVVREKAELRKWIGTLAQRVGDAAVRAVERLHARLAYCKSHVAGPLDKMTDYRLRLDELCSRLCKTVERTVDMKISDLRHRQALLLRNSPAGAVSQRRADGAALSRSLSLAVRSVLDKNSAAFGSLASRLNALSPLGVLERGYSITQKLPDLEVIFDAGQVEAGDFLRVTLCRGQIECTVRHSKARPSVSDNP
jgi:exodeoxyribonuclease VII large subunit